MTEQRMDDARQQYARCEAPVKSSTLASVYRFPEWPSYFIFIRNIRSRA
jgi:hypothetical protein